MTAVNGGDSRTILGGVLGALVCDFEVVVVIEDEDANAGDDFERCGFALTLLKSNDFVDHELILGKSAAVGVDGGVFARPSN